MPQMLTYSVSAAVDKGPAIKSDAKLETSSYSAWMEEIVCRCGVGHIELSLGTAAQLKQLGMIVIAADRYTNEKECVTANGKAPCTCVQFKFDTATDLTKPCPKPADAAACDNADVKGKWHNLSSAQVITDCYISAVVPENATRLCIYNALSSDIKVSVLVTRKPSCLCAVPAAA
jgi:hypothetical protein